MNVYLNAFLREFICLSQEAHIIFVLGYNTLILSTQKKRVSNGQRANPELAIQNIES